MSIWATWSCWQAADIVKVKCPKKQQLAWRRLWMFFAQPKSYASEFIQFQNGQHCRCQNSPMRLDMARVCQARSNFQPARGSAKNFSNAKDMLRLWGTPWWDLSPVFGTCVWLEHVGTSSEYGSFDARKNPGFHSSLHTSELCLFFKYKYKYINININVYIYIYIFFGGSTSMCIAGSVLVRGGTCRRSHIARQENRAPGDVTSWKCWGMGDHVHDLHDQWMSVINGSNLDAS